MVDIVNCDLPEVALSHLGNILHVELQTGQNLVLYHTSPSVPCKITATAAQPSTAALQECACMHASLLLHFLAMVSRTKSLKDPSNGSIRNESNSPNPIGQPQTLREHYSSRKSMLFVMSKGHSIADA